MRSVRSISQKLCVYGDIHLNISLRVYKEALFPKMIFHSFKAFRCCGNEYCLPKDVRPDLCVLLSCYISDLLMTF